MADNSPPAGWDSAPVVKPEGWDSAPVVKTSGPAAGEYESGPLSQQELARSAKLAADPTAEGDVDVSDPKWQRVTGNTPEDAKSREEKSAAREFLSFAAAPGMAKVGGALVKGAVGGAARVAETGALGNAAQKFSDATRGIRHAATGGGIAGLAFGHGHAGAAPIAIDAAVSAAPTVIRQAEKVAITLGQLSSKPATKEIAKYAEKLATLGLRASQIDLAVDRANKDLDNATQ